MITKPPFFLVLGMHRSGTSCLTGALERCGVYLGDVRRNGKHNKRGYFEIRQLQQLHDEILESNNGNWHNPPSAITVNNNQRQMLIHFFSQLNGNRPCAIKDPRLLLLYPVWQEIIGKSCKLIGTFRHPISVAQSIAKRNNLSIEQGLALWKTYNTALVKAHIASPFPLIHYDLSKKNLYLQKIMHLAHSLELKPRKISLFFFISSSLEHQQSTTLPVPPDCQELYSYLIKNRLT